MRLVSCCGLRFNRGNTGGFSEAGPPSVNCSLYHTRSVLTLSRSASEGHNQFPRLRFGLVSLHTAMRCLSLGCVGYKYCPDVCHRIPSCVSNRPHPACGHPLPDEASGKKRRRPFR